MQLVLDPADTEIQGHFTPLGPLPTRLREFGRFPNSDEWRVGDIILFSDCRPGLVARSIREVQTATGYALEDARWQHAAIYVGQQNLCEAVWPRIRFHPIFDRIGSQMIRVRRFREDISPDQRYELAINAMSHIGMFYGWAELPRLLLRRGQGWLRPGSLRTRPVSLICSVLCANAYMTTLSRVITSHSAQVATTPADLSLTDQLVDVPVCWRRLGRG